MTDEEIAKEKEERRLAGRGLATRTADCKRVHRLTRDPRAGIRAYCRGNKWLIANAKAVGNWR